MVDSPDYGLDVYRRDHLVVGKGTARTLRTPPYRGFTPGDAEESRGGHVKPPRVLCLCFRRFRTAEHQPDGTLSYRPDCARLDPDVKGSAALSSIPGPWQGGKRAKSAMSEGCAHSYSTCIQLPVFGLSALPYMYLLFQRRRPNAGPEKPSVSRCMYYLPGHSSTQCGTFYFFFSRHWAEDRYHSAVV